MMYDEVRALELFDDLSDEMLRALVDASDEVTFENGETLFVENQPAIFWWVLLDGQVELVRHVGRERAVMGAMERPGQWGGGWVAFDPHGVYLISACAISSGRMMRVPAAALRTLIEGVPVVRHLTDGVFHTAREIEASTRQREALVALGTLSAGLAHELNNPAAAATRAVDSLEGTMREALAALRGLADAGVSSDQYKALDALRREAEPRASGVDPLATADREDALSDWMDTHGVERGWVLAPALVSASFEPEWCDRVLETVGSPALQAGLDWVASTVTTTLLLSEVKESTQRISGLITSVKSYSQMDRGSFQRIDVTEGVESTLTMLAHKLTPNVTVVREYADDVPQIDAYAGELNQVWTNLIDNAIDAMESQGTLTISTSSDGSRVVVQIADTGSGMTSEVVEHAFDTFFTTKEVGKGTGLGLSIARRIVVDRHGGDIAVEAAPGHTTFSVTLPVYQRPADSHV